MRALVILFLFLCSPAWAELVTEKRKMINVVGINTEYNFGFIALFNRDTSESDAGRCGPLQLLKLSLETEEERMLFSTLVAAKTASRAVTVTFDRDQNCFIRQAHFQ